MDDRPQDSSVPVTAPAQDDRSRRLRNRLWRIAGTISVGVGIFNAFVPLLPTTVFLLIGLWAYGKGAPELRAKLLAHPRFGPSLQLWQQRRAIRRSAKGRAIASIAAGYVFTLVLAGFGTATVLIGVGLGVLSVYLWTRPEG
jgi:uncharacterized membrane protein YbaN (DUF454 family)